MKLQKIAILIVSVFCLETFGMNKEYNNNEVLDTFQKFTKKINDYAYEQNENNRKRKFDEMNDEDLGYEINKESNKIRLELSPIRPWVNKNDRKEYLDTSPYEDPDMNILKTIYPLRNELNRSSMNDKYERLNFNRIMIGISDAALISLIKYHLGMAISNDNYDFTYKLLKKYHDKPIKSYDFLTLNYPLGNDKFKTTKHEYSFVTKQFTWDDMKNFFLKSLKRFEKTNNKQFTELLEKIEKNRSTEKLTKN